MRTQAESDDATPAAPGDAEDDNVAAMQAAALARSVLIGKLLLIPKLKLKASGIFQPEDHASVVRSRFGRMGTALNYGGIFGSGYLLFWGHAVAFDYLNCSTSTAVALVPQVDEDTGRAGRLGPNLVQKPQPCAQTPALCNSLTSLGFQLNKKETLLAGLLRLVHSEAFSMRSLRRHSSHCCAWADHPT